MKYAMRVDTHEPPTDYCGVEWEFDPNHPDQYELVVSDDERYVDMTLSRTEAVRLMSIIAQAIALVDELNERSGWR